MVLIATIDITIPITNGNAGAVLRAIAKNVERVAGEVPDRVGSGSSLVLTIDNAPGTNLVCGVQLTAGPYTSASLAV